MKKRLIALVLTLAVAMSVLVFFAACDEAGEDPILYALERRIEELERDAAAGGQDAILRELEVMLLERDLRAANSALEAANAHIALFGHQLAAALAAYNNATTPEEIEAARAHRDLVQGQFDDALAREDAIRNEIIDLEEELNRAPDAMAAQAMFDRFNRRIVRTDGYVLIPNRHYNIHASQWPTIPGTHMTRPTRTVRVPVNPQRVAVMCSSFLDIMIALGVQDRVVAFTHMEQPPFIEYYFPRTGAHALPDLTSTTAPIEPHSPDFPTLLEIEPDLILSSSRARARPRNYFGRMSYIAPTVDIGSRTGYNIFIEDVVENIITLAAIFELEEIAFDEVVALLARIRQINELATDLEANALIVQFNGMTAMSLFGASSRYSFVHRELGIEQAASPTGASQVLANATYQHGTPAGAELLREINPDIIFVVDRYALNAHRDAPTPINLLNHTLFEGMYAIQNNHVHQLNPVNWYLVLCGFRSLMYQFDEIYAALRQLEASRA